MWVAAKKDLAAATSLMELNVPIAFQQSSSLNSWTNRRGDKEILQISLSIENPHFIRGLLCACSGGFEPYPGVVEADAPADGVEQAGVLQGGVDPHCSVGVNPGPASFLALNDDAVDRNVTRAGREVAEAESEADDTRAHGLGGFDRADHGLLASTSDVEVAGQVGRTDDLDLLTFAKPESFDINRVDQEPVIRHER